MEGLVRFWESVRDAWDSDLVGGWWWFQGEVCLSFTVRLLSRGSDENGFRCDHRRTDQRAGGVRIRVDSRVCMLVSALSVWTAVSEYTQRFGVPVLDIKG